MRIHGIVVSRTSAAEHVGKTELLVSATQIAAVVREILRDEIDLARALRLEQLRLAHDFVERERSCLPRMSGIAQNAQPWSHPSLIFEVADVGQPGGELPHARMRDRHVLGGEQAALFELRDEAIHLRRAEEEIDLGQRSTELVLVALDHAPHADDGFAAAAFL